MVTRQHTYIFFLFLFLNFIKNVRLYKAKYDGLKIYINEIQMTTAAQWREEEIELYWSKFSIFYMN